MVRKNRLAYSSLFSILLILCATSIVSASFGDWFNDVKAGITGHATSQSVGLNVTIGNNPPNIVLVSPILAQSPTEASLTTISVNFTVFDNDGAGTINNASARVNFTRSGEPLRQTASCSQLNTFGTNYANYSCTIQMWYFDLSGTWTVMAQVNDTTSIAANTSSSFTYNQLSAFVQGPSSLNWASLTSGATNQTSSTDPLVLNNTGNKPITDGNLQINSTNLLGETDSSKGIWASNFTVTPFNNTATNYECSATSNQTTANLLSSNFTQIVNATLSRGNNTINLWNGTSGQSQLFFCIRLVGSDLSSQAYSTANQGSWTTKII